MEYIKNSIAYKNSNQSKKNNLYNTFSQIYSRNKVKDLFEKYSTDYDFVISTCFDGFEFSKKYDISYIQQNKIYASSIHKPRYIIPDNFLIIPPEIYINWFNFYKNIKNILNNQELELKINNINEKLEFNMEELLLSNYLLCGYNLNNIEFTF
jgi:hypothetical protein